MTSETDPLLLYNSNSLGRGTEEQYNTTTTTFQQQQQQQHPDYLKTYTAGEDSSRLAAAAKELGLAKQRKSRQQVRKDPFRRVILPALAGFVEEPDKSNNDILSTKSSSNQHNIWETLAGVAGNILEWYDFAVFGYFGDVIGKVFFPPNQSGDSATMESFLVFGGAFLMRPIGGLLLGYLGDVYGRKQALTTSIFLMAFPTFIMGCLPSYERVGYWSTISLVIIRMLQGMSVGGQLMSSLVFTLENVDTQRWGLYGSFVWATGNFGVLLGSLVGYIVRGNFTHDELVAYGWRIPFLCGIVVSFAGIYLKSTEEGSSSNEEGELHDDGTNIIEQVIDYEMGDGLETPKLSSSSLSKKKQKKKKQNPLLLVFSKNNIRPLLSSAMVPMMWSSGFYLTFVWMAIYMTDLSDHPVQGAFAVNAISLLLSVCLLFPIAGWLSDIFGRRIIMSIGGITIALFSPTFIRIIGGSYCTDESDCSWFLPFIAQTILGICLSFWGSPMCAWLVESFEPEARLTSVAVGYNVAHAIVGGSTPAIATYMVDVLGPTSPGWIYTIVATIAMTGLWIVAPSKSSSSSTPKS